MGPFVERHIISSQTGATATVKSGQQADYSYEQALQCELQEPTYPVQHEVPEYTASAGFYMRPILPRNERLHQSIMPRRALRELGLFSDGELFQAKAPEELGYEGKMDYPV